MQAIIKNQLYVFVALLGLLSAYNLAYASYPSHNLYVQIDSPPNGYALSITEITLNPGCDLNNGKKMAYNGLTTALTNHKATIKFTGPFIKANCGTNMSNGTNFFTGTLTVHLRGTTPNRHSQGFDGYCTIPFAMTHMYDGGGFNPGYKYAGVELYTATCSNQETLQIHFPDLYTWHISFQPNSL